MKQIKRALTFVFIVFDIILLTGGYSAHSRMYQWLGRPIADILLQISHWVGGVNGIGWGIIIITAVLRLAILPLFVNQQKNTTMSQLKLRILKPEVDKIRDITQNAKSPQEQQAAAAASMSLYKENGVSMTGGISFLTMAIQLPIFSGVYSAIMHAHGLQSATFFGLALNKPQIVFAILAGLIYLLQAWLSLQRMPEEQRKVSGMMLLMSPIMITAFSMFSSGSIGLYFIVGGIFALIQTAILHVQYPALEAKVNREFKVLKTAEDLMASQPAAAVTPTDLSPRDITATASSSNTKQRNSGKQNRNNKG